MLDADTIYTGSRVGFVLPNVSIVDQGTIKEIDKLFTSVGES